MFCLCVCVCSDEILDFSLRILYQMKAKEQVFLFEFDLLG